MTVIASITTSVDGYVTGPDDGPECGLGKGGERLHHWVMGGPWTYETEHEPGVGMGPEDRAFFDELTAHFGAGICGRTMYEAAGRWGGTNPFPGPLFVLTHRMDHAPDRSTGFHFVGNLSEALAQASDAADGNAVAIAGGADLVRQCLSAGYVDELVVSVAPVILGAGKRLFDGFDQDLDLEIRSVHTSPFATHIWYRVKR